MASLSMPSSTTPRVPGYRRRRHSLPTFANGPTPVTIPTQHRPRPQALQQFQQTLREGACWLECLRVRRLCSQAAGRREGRQGRGTSLPPNGGKGMEMLEAVHVLRESTACELMLAEVVEFYGANYTH